MQDHVTARGARIVETRSFAQDGARLILDHAIVAIEARGVFRMALAGGSTPRPVYAELARLASETARGEDQPIAATQSCSATASPLDWKRVQLTFGDERCVPPDDEQSNYRMVRETLLDRVPIPGGNVFRIRGEIDAREAVREYEEKLAALASRFGESRYRHDLILLGLGQDGHTASLFPGSAALMESVHNVQSVIGPKPPPERVTFTLPLINAARAVCFLVNEPAKASVVREALAGDPRHPASAVKAATWLLGFDLNSAA